VVFEQAYTLAYNINQQLQYARRITCFKCETRYDGGRRGRPIPEMWLLLPVSCVLAEKLSAHARPAVACSDRGRVHRAVSRRAVVGSLRFVRVSRRSSLDSVWHESRRGERADRAHYRRVAGTGAPASTRWVCFSYRRSSPVVALTTTARKLTPLCSRAPRRIDEKPTAICNYSNCN